MSWSFIYFLKIIFSFIIVLVSISYLIEMIFSLFFWVHVLNTIVVLISKSISLFLVIVLSSLSYIVTEKVIRFSNSNSFPFLSFLVFQYVKDYESGLLLFNLTKSSNITFFFAFKVFSYLSFFFRFNHVYFYEVFFVILYCFRLITIYKRYSIFFFY